MEIVGPGNRWTNPRRPHKGAALLGASEKQNFVPKPLETTVYNAIIRSKYSTIDWLCGLTIPMYLSEPVAVVSMSLPRQKILLMQY